MKIVKENKFINRLKLFIYGVWIFIATDVLLNGESQWR